MHLSIEFFHKLCKVPLHTLGGPVLWCRSCWLSLEHVTMVAISTGLAGLPGMLCSHVFSLGYKMRRHELKENTEALLAKSGPCV